MSKTDRVIVTGYLFYQLMLSLSTFKTCLKFNPKCRLTGHKQWMDLSKYYA